VSTSDLGPVYTKLLLFIAISIRFCGRMQHYDNTADHIVLLMISLLFSPNLILSRMHTDLRRLLLLRHKSSRFRKILTSIFI